MGDARMYGSVGPDSAPLDMPKAPWWEASSGQKKPKGDAVYSGKRKPKVVLSAIQILEIHDLAKGENRLSQPKIAAMFGVTQARISTIVNNKKYVRGKGWVERDPEDGVMLVETEEEDDPE